MPVKLEILSLVPITFVQCLHCESFFSQSGIGQQAHSQILAEYPPDILEMQQRLSTLVVELINCYNDGIELHLIDPQSLPGIIKSLRYRVRRYPTFIVDGKEIIEGWDRKALDKALQANSSK